MPVATIISRSHSTQRNCWRACARFCAARLELRQRKSRLACCVSTRARRASRWTAIRSSSLRLNTACSPIWRIIRARWCRAPNLWNVLGLLIGGLLLSGVFRSSVQSDFDARLRFDLDGMIAAAEPGPAGQVSLEGRFTDPRFERVYSGWYWQITPTGKGAKLTDAQISRSLWDHTIKITDSRQRAGLDWGHASGPEDKQLRFVSRHIEFPISDTPQTNDTASYTFLVAGDITQVENEVQQFNGTLIWSFAVLGLGLLAGIFIQVRVGLVPLRRLSEALARIHVSNLAHFLKTPLSVITSEASANPGPLADAVTRQVGTMRRQIDHYLARARAR